MSDIIDRLRNARTSLGHSLVFGLVAEAADLIEAQQRRIAELETELLSALNQAEHNGNELSALRAKIENAKVVRTEAYVLTGVEVTGHLIRKEDLL